VVLFAAAIMGPVAHAVVITVLGVGLHQLYVYFRKHEYWYLCVFNTSQKILAVGLSALAIQAVAAGPVLPLGPAQNLAPLALATAVYFLVNTGLISILLAFMGSRHPWEVWVKTHRWTWHLYLSHLILGILVADLYLEAPLVLPPVVVLSVALRHAYASTAALRKHTREAFEMLADTVDQRDPHTAQHSQQVADYCRMLGRRLELADEEIEIIVQAARVHNVGKIAVSERILQKPGVLSREELDEIRRHALVGAQLVGKLPHYERGREYILCHHEWYDGSGTLRLRGEEIPLGARIIAVADAFHAMTSDRPYRAALGWRSAMQELERQKGRQFDPVVVEALLEALHERLPVEESRLDTLMPSMPREVPTPRSMVRH
ncbi:MAG: HD-GYP domain-containing protein, partial [Armatimonadetes bacterium]|nr:HD-GYP domain-containing protein [Armatimonadota bacterium]